jgi:hypothetical protein
LLLNYDKKTVLTVVHVVEALKSWRSAEISDRYAVPSTLPTCFKNTDTQLGKVCFGFKKERQMMFRDFKT